MRSRRWLWLPTSILRDLDAAARRGGTLPDMTELYLLRHADAGDPEAWKGDDADRPLSGKGEKQSERLGRFLAGTAFRADVVLTSPKVRALRTAEIVAERLGLDGDGGGPARGRP